MERPSPGPAQRATKPPQPRLLLRPRASSPASAADRTAVRIIWRAMQATPSRTSHHGRRSRRAARLLALAGPLGLLLISPFATLRPGATAAPPAPLAARAPPSD